MQVADRLKAGPIRRTAESEPPASSSLPLWSWCVCVSRGTGPDDEVWTAINYNRSRDPKSSILRPILGVVMYMVEKWTAIVLGR